MIRTCQYSIKPNVRIIFYGMWEGLVHVNSIIKDVPIQIVSKKVVYAKDVRMYLHHLIQIQVSLKSRFYLPF